MTVTVKDLYPTTTLPTTSTTLYTCAVTNTIVDKITGYNTGAVSTITVSLGGVLVKKTLQTDEAYTFPEISGHTLNTGQTIVTTTTAATINLRISGREVS